MPIRRQREEKIMETNNMETNPTAETLLETLAKRGGLIGRFFRRLNKNETMSAILILREGIVFGRLCNDTKKLFSDAKKKNLFSDPKKNWTEWVSAEVPNYSKRTVEDYMLLARIPNVEKYVHFGKARLLLISSRVKWRNLGENPIGDFLRTNAISFNPDAPTPVGIFKSEIDTAIKFTAGGITGIDGTLRRDMAKREIACTAGLVQHLKSIQGDGGDVNAALRTFCENGGKLAENVKVANRYQNFDERTKMLATSINELFADPNDTSQIRKDSLLALRGKLDELLARIEQPQAENTAA